MGRNLFGFSQVHAEELKLIGKRRKRIQQRTSGRTEKTSVSDGIIGLALSGGGIRSAATNLGVLQGLSKTRALEFVDVLT